MLKDFETTSWTVVLAAKDSEAPTSRDALNSLCGTYWPPLYAYIRRLGFSEEDAQDLTQGFFAHLLGRDFLRNVEQDRGRFRSFLLASLRNFLTNTWKKGQAQKRGGSLPRPLPLDFAMAERRYALGLKSEVDPRVLFDRHWARTVLDTVLQHLREEFAARGRSEVFDGLKGCLISGTGHSSYCALGKQLGMSEGAVKMAVHRMRRRYAELIWEEVARTVERPEDIEQELDYLIKMAGS